MHDRSIIALLEKLGLSRNEVKCYLVSISVGMGRIAEIAKIAGINRVNAYSAVASLIERGLLEQEITRKGRRVQATPFERLQELAQQHQKRATKLRWNVEDMIGKLMVAAVYSHGAPSIGMGAVTFCRGDDAFYQIAERTLNVPRGSTIDFLESFGYFQPPENPTYDDEYYIPRRIEQGISARVLHPTGTYAQRLKSRDAKENRETRLLPADINFPCSIYVYGSEVAFLWTAEHAMGIIVHDGPLVDLMRKIFEMVWKVAGKAGIKKKI